MKTITALKKFLVLFLSLSLLSAALTGCGNDDDIKPLPIPTVEPLYPDESASGPSDELSPDAGTNGGLSYISDRQEVNGKMQSYLTGEWKDVDVVNRRPIAVMIPNDTRALPQYALSRAAIIYEAPMEYGSTTRLMGMFEDFDDLDHIGPVRSSRDYFLYVAMGYDSIYCNWGLAIPYVGPIINSDRVDNISQSLKGIDVGAPEAYDRISRPGYADEYTGYLIIDGLFEGVERLGYDWNYSAEFIPQLLFANDNARAEYADQPSATAIYPGGTKNNSGGYGTSKPYFEYNEADQLYYRFQDGNKQIDEMNGEQLTVANVIFQYCHGEQRDPNGYLAFDVHGEDDATIFTNGKVIEGRWIRNNGDDTPAKFYDNQGNEIIFNQGQTWICNIWREYREYAEYE